MSLGDYIKWCGKCNARILTTDQINKKQDCYDCQKKHAESFPKRMEEAQMKEA
jgi:hypothetical protein